MRVKLREIAHARAGDKGNISNVSVWVYDPQHYELLKAQLTPERIKQAYPRLFRGSVERYDLDRIHGLNFVLHDAIEGGVNSSLNLDSHGKSWSFLILDLDVEVP
ncbi:MAG: hypothetical protein ACFCUQ_05050 [Kiloniellales bacterium]